MARWRRFTLDPAQARPYPGVCERLDAIMEDRRTRLVLISGRWTRDLLPLLTLRRRPEIWGSHGWEQLKPDGGYAVAPIQEEALRCLLEADELERRIEKLGGRCERKPGGFAVHWRGLAPNQIADIRSEVFENWMDQGCTATSWHDFDGGVELRAPGRHKGYVVDSLLTESPGAVAAYLGDDATDEDAFRAIKDKGLGVLVRPEFRPDGSRSVAAPTGGIARFSGSAGATPGKRHEVARTKYLQQPAPRLARQAPRHRGRRGRPAAAVAAIRSRPGSLAWARRTETRVDDIVVGGSGRDQTGVPPGRGALSRCANTSRSPDKVVRIVGGVALVALLLQAGAWGQRGIALALRLKKDRRRRRDHARGCSASWGASCCGRWCC